MINPASVAFDFDGVVADTMSLFLEIVRDVYGINSIRYEDITCYDLIECTDLKPEIIDSVYDRVGHPTSRADDFGLRVSQFRFPAFRT